MSGLVFHPGHEELHGITVAIVGASGRTWVGRYHERNSRGIVLRDVALHDPATTELSRADWIARQQRFGVRVAEGVVTVPAEEVVSLSRLAQWRDGEVPPPGV